MRRLYVRIYFAVLASLAVFALAAGLLWRAFGEDGPWSQAYEVAATLAQNALPPAGAPKTEQQAALERLAANLRADVALFAPDRSPLAVCRRCGQRRTHRRERGAVRGEERDVGAQVGGKPLERRLLLGLRRARGRQRILRKRRRHFVGLAPWAVLAERAPEQARGEREHGEAREHREIDAQVKAAH